MSTEERIAIIEAKKATLVKERSALQAKLDRLHAKMAKEAKEKEEKT